MSSSKVFRGDHEDLVDHLIFASNEHKTRTQPMAGFGRELQPFFTPGEELAPLVPAKKWQSCGSPPRAAGKARKGCASPPARAPSARGGKPRSSCEQQPSAAVPTGGKQQRNRTAGGVLASPACSSSSLGTPQQSSSRTSFTSMGSSPGAACPAFFSSPKPEVLPMPTTGLLSKAGTLLRPDITMQPAMAQRGFAIPTAAA